MSYCAFCNNKLTNQHAKVKCVDCNKFFHLKCVKMTKADVEALASENIDWRCEPCSSDRRKSVRLESASSSGNVTLEDIMNELFDLKKTQKETVKGYNDSIELLHSKIDEVKNKVLEQSQTMEKYFVKMEALESENKRLRNLTDELKMRLEEQEQYSRSNCIEIHGVPETRNENVTDVVKKVGTAIGLEVKDFMIDNCHRLGKSTQDRPAGIIVKFVRRVDREEFLSKKRAKKTLSTRHMDLNSDIPVFVNESLCPARRKLYAQARQAKKDSNYKYIWLRGGRIFMRKNDGDPVVTITRSEDLSNL